ncbi:MAG: methyltransferase domain-containing protein [Geobacteraceae bacterium]|nr:methyltransferase domain-containing protein [Geobacteraceae bacterium]NTW79108.1 methyltransferase domain-containing protein [Geobacteraceae bacterium]
MKEFLLQHLICPSCLPKENSLAVKVQKIDRHCNNDILSGELHCLKCKRDFPIKNGIANLQVNQDVRGIRYEDPDMVDRYLLSHYSDLLDSTELISEPFFWDSLLETNRSLSFDAGCSVGRLVFEMANKSSWAVGCDLSESFISTARNLMNSRRYKFSLPLEGKLRETFDVNLPDSWRTDNAEFIVADAQYLPFRRETFQQVSSLNLLDRVPYPLAHLYEMNRVVSQKNASFLFADPYSWLTSPAPEERWLGGSTTGNYAGRGKDIVRELLQGKGSILMPAWQIEESGRHKWTLRTHRNHIELVYSDFMVAKR